MLAWAAGEGRVVLTHDVSTMTVHALHRVGCDQRMPGLLAVPRKLPIRDIIEDLFLIATAGDGTEWDCQVRYLPLR